jgi:hypothetical protein
VKFECRIDGTRVFLPTWGDVQNLTVELGRRRLQAVSPNQVLHPGGERVPSRRLSDGHSN